MIHNCHIGVIRTGPLVNMHVREWSNQAIPSLSMSTSCKSVSHHYVLILAIHYSFTNFHHICLQFIPNKRWNKGESAGSSQQKEWAWKTRWEDRYSNHIVIMQSNICFAQIIAVDSTMISHNWAVFWHTVIKCGVCPVKRVIYNNRGVEYFCKPLHPCHILIRVWAPLKVWS